MMFFVHATPYVSPGQSWILENCGFRGGVQMQKNQRNTNKYELNLSTVRG